jgi:hypothetical protein
VAFDIQVPPIIILDEFGALEESNARLLRLSRNVFRALGLPLIVMGTNASVANMVDASTESRGRATGAALKDWCYLFHILPKFCLLDEEKTTKIIPEWSHGLLLGSRPLFSIFTVDFFRDRAFAGLPNDLSLELFNELLNHVANSSFRSKNLFSAHDTDYYGLAGQLYLFMNSSTDDEDFTELLHKHFATLPQSFPSPLTLQIKAAVNSNCLYSCGKEWKIVTTFPEFSRDLLLYLSLMGTESTSAFYYDYIDELHWSDGRLSMKSAIKTWENSNRARTGGRVNTKNRVARKSDGQFAEAFFCGSSIISSRLGGGIKGIDGVQFLNNFLRQCLDFDGKIEFADAEVSDYFKGLWIPFMSPPNQEFPEPVCKLFDLLKTQGGNMKRTEDKTRIDCSCVSTSGKVVLTGESKDYKKKIPLDKLQGIILRIPVETPLHVVFSNSLQTDYFRDTTYEDWSEAELKYSIEKEKLAELEKKAEDSGLKAKKGKKQQQKMKIQVTKKMKQDSLEFQKRKNAVFVKVGENGKVVPVCTSLSSTWAKDIGADKKFVVLFIERGMFC